jgi:hypothetical protein
MSITYTNTISITEDYTSDGTNYAGNLDNSVFEVNTSINNFINNQGIIYGGGGSGGVYNENDVVDNTWNLSGKPGQHGIYISPNGSINNLTNTSFISGGGGGGAANLDFDTFMGFTGGNGGAGGGGGSGTSTYAYYGNDGGFGNNPGTLVEPQAGGGGGGFNANGGGNLAGSGGYGFGGGGQGAALNSSEIDINGTNATSISGGNGGYIGGGGGAGGGAGGDGVYDFNYTNGSGGGGSGGGIGGHYTASHNDNTYILNGGNGGYSILNEGTITTLSNFQNISQGYGPLYIAGNAPIAYNIIISSLTSYGQLWSTGVTGTVNVGFEFININDPENIPGIYTNVLLGITPSSLFGTLPFSFQNAVVGDNIPNYVTVYFDWKLLANNNNGYDLYIVVPLPPTNVGATGGIGQISISWDPADGNGYDILSYTLNYSTDGITYTQYNIGTNLSATITSLSNGVTYYLTVTAFNLYGSSTSTQVNATTDNGAPDPPTNVNGVKDGNSAIITWSPPINDGGSPIISYTVSASPNISDVTVLGATTTTATIPNLLDYVTYTFTVVATNEFGDSSPSSSVNVLCFLQGSKILCLIDNKEEYIPIEDIRKDTLVKTSLDGYKKVVHIGSSTIINTSDDNRTKDRLYLLSKNKYPELNEDLIITGSHSILVDSLSDYQVNTTKEMLGRLFITSEKYRLMAFLDDKAEIYKPSGKHTIWHLALENEEYTFNYGIYANGLLVESLSIRMFEQKGYLKA